VTRYVAIHGAFRGPWYWEPLAEMLAARGDELFAVDLRGDSLENWMACTRRTLDEARGSLGRDDPVVVLAHSMGGVVAQAAVPAFGPGIDRLVLLDAPLIEVGRRAVDVSGPSPPPDDMLPPRSMQIPPSPVGPEQGFTDAALASWVNERLRPVPMGPQLDVVPPRPDGATTAEVTTSLVFCDRTPDGYPSTYTRRRCEREGRPHVVLDEHHDVAVLAPEVLARLLWSLESPSAAVE
jgi:pimeloyl-ACP methyl ester carboxylesterase